jgi:hypothetical protein
MKPQPQHQIRCHCRMVSQLTMMPRSARRSSTFRGKWGQRSPAPFRSSGRRLGNSRKKASAGLRVMTGFRSDLGWLKGNGPMARCAICKSKKGQRGCKLADALVCSLCCGQHRQRECCQGCLYYRDVKPIRNYGAVPRFSTARMEADLDLQSYANTIESALCLWDHSMHRTLKDDSALKVLERLLDRYYFKEETVGSAGEPIRRGVQVVLSAIEKDLSDVPDEVIVRVVSVIYFVAKRRSKGGREYFDAIHTYVGVRVGPGIRILRI